MYAHLPKPCAGHRNVLQVVISAIFQDRRGFVNDGTITSYQTRQNPEIQKILGFLLDVAKRQRGPGHHTKQGTNGRTGYMKDPAATDPVRLLGRVSSLSIQQRCWISQSWFLRAGSGIFANLANVVIAAV